MPTYTPLIGRINDLGIDCSYRQFDYWCRKGYLGDRMVSGVPGWQRDITVTDLEMLYAFTELRKLTQSIDLAHVAAVIAARPIDPVGEVLVVEADGMAFRFDHWCGVGDDLATPVCVIPLRSFAMAGSSTATGESPPVAPQPAGEPGAAASPTAVPTSHGTSA